METGSRDTEAQNAPGKDPEVSERRLEGPVPGEVGEPPGPSAPSFLSPRVLTPHLLSWSPTSCPVHTLAPWDRLGQGGGAKRNRQPPPRSEVQAQPQTGLSQSGQSRPGSEWPVPFGAHTHPAGHGAQPLWALVCWPVR